MAAPRPSPLNSPIPTAMIRRTVEMPASLTLGAPVLPGRKYNKMIIAPDGRIAESQRGGSRRLAVAGRP
jgi:hypothetical protein